jgi:hypothetical protein
MNTPTAVFDPIRFCVFTTVALIAWAIGPPATVMVMSGMGLWAYWNAWRRGLRETKCVLGDPRIVMFYLALAFAAGAIFAMRGLLARFL